MEQIMKKTVEIEVTTVYRLSYDPLSKECVEALDDYRAIIDKEGDWNEMLKHVVHNVKRFGTSSMVEGVGYIGHSRRDVKKEPYSGIEVEDDNPDSDYNIIG